jgi:hypothetical protein
MRGTDPDAKAVSAKMRSAGHFWGSKAADAVIAEGAPLTAATIERRLEQVLAERQPALRALGAADDEIAAWTAACAKRYAERLCSHFGGGHDSEMKRPQRSDFDVVVLEAGVKVTFKPTETIYTFHLLAEPADRKRLGPVSPDGIVRHAGPTGDTGDYLEEDVRRLAWTLATEAVKEKK